MAAAEMPLPSELITPPVTKIYLVEWDIKNSKKQVGASTRRRILLK